MNFAEQWNALLHFTSNAGLASDQIRVLFMQECRRLDNLNFYLPYTWILSKFLFTLSKKQKPRRVKNEMLGVNENS
jgi:hypothetical protein